VKKLPPPKLLGLARILLTDGYSGTHFRQIAEFAGIPRDRCTGSNKSECVGNAIEYLKHKQDLDGLTELLKAAKGEGYVQPDKLLHLNSVWEDFCVQFDAWEASQSTTTSGTALPDFTLGDEQPSRESQPPGDPSPPLAIATPAATLTQSNAIPPISRPLQAAPTRHFPAEASQTVDSGSDIRCDIAFICALPVLELNRLMAAFPAKWVEASHIPSDPQTYWQTTFRTARGHDLAAIAAAPTRMGMSAASILTTKVLLRFRPRLVAMVGIAAGAKPDAQGYGDILAAETTFDCSAGKLVPHPETSSVRHLLLPDPKPISIQPAILARLTEWQRQDLYLGDIARSWQAKPPQSRLRLHIGPLASGSAVIDDKEAVEEVRAHWRKLVGIEMEAHGVHAACHETARPAPAFLCLKSVSDFAHQKDDAWQEYAAYTAAHFCARFVIEEWERLVS
jgi:nucleoside phosphorylase